MCNNFIIKFWVYYDFFKVSYALTYIVTPIQISHRKQSRFLSKALHHLLTSCVHLFCVRKNTVSHKRCLLTAKMVTCDIRVCWLNSQFYTETRGTRSGLI